MRGRVIGALADPSFDKTSSLLRVSASVVAARSAETRSWSSASRTTSQVEVNPISSGSVNAEAAGPRRAAITTSCTCDARSAASA